MCSLLRADFFKYYKLQIKLKHKFLLKRRGVQFLNDMLILFAGVKFRLKFFNLWVDFQFPQFS